MLPVEEADDKQNRQRKTILWSYSNEWKALNNLAQGLNQWQKISHLPNVPQVKTAINIDNDVLFRTACSYCRLYLSEDSRRPQQSKLR